MYDIVYTHVSIKRSFLFRNTSYSRCSWAFCLGKDEAVCKATTMVLFEEYSDIYSYVDPDTFEPPHDKTNKLACAPNEDSDQPGHPHWLIRVLAVRMKKAWIISYPLSAQRRLWSDWADAQADLSLRWAHMPFCWFCHVAARLSSQRLTSHCRH